MNTATYGTEISEQAASDGVTPIWINSNAKDGDARLTLWQFGDVRVIDTNGGACWEESDPEGFAALLWQILTSYVDANQEGVN